jgi:LacI family transcriptional regulator
MVAQRAGVSPSTVSRILNGTAQVSQAKRTAIDEAIASLGFVPNPIARGLAGGKTFSIGVVTQAIDSPFYGTMLRGIEDACQPLGYSLLFMSGDWNAKQEAHCVDVLRSRRVDGVIVLTGRLSDNALMEYAKSLPVVVTGRQLQAPQLYSLNFDNFAGAQLATQHLIELGHRYIAFIAGDKEHPDGQERFLGYCAALESAQIPYDERLVIWGDYHESSGFQAANTLLEKGLRFSAIFAANDQMAHGAALGLHKSGLSVPQHISLVGFDDLPTSAFSTPPLTTVHQPAYEMGGLAAAAMVDLLRGRVPNVFVPIPRLIIRESSRSLLK